MRQTLTLALLSVCAMTCEAQQTLTLEECRKMALQNSHEIMAAKSKTEEAEHTSKSYKANYLPTLDLNIIGAYSTIGKEETVAIGEQNLPVIKGDPAQGGFAPQKVDLSNKMDFISKSTGEWAYFPGIAMPVEFEIGPVVVAGVTLQQPIYMGGKIANASKMAQLAVEASQQNEELAKVHAITNVDKAYALLVKAKEMKKVAESFNLVLQELMGNVTKAKQHGMKTSNDVLKVQVKLNESELALQKASNAIVLAKMNLCHAIGIDLNSDIDVTDGYPETTVTEGSVAQRPESQMLDKKVAVAEAKTKIERSAILPEVGAVLSYNYVHGVQLNDEPIFDAGDFTAILKVKVPLFNFGKSTNKVRAAKSSLEQARIEKQNLTEMMELELQKSKNAMSEAEKELEVAQRSLEQAAENMRASKSLYDNGYETLSDHMEAQVLWQKAMAAKVEADFALHLAKVEHNRAAGTLVADLQ